MFQVAGDCGLGAIDAACEKTKIAIGVDADQSAQGDCVVTSALKPLTDRCSASSRLFQDGDFKGGTNNFYGVSSSRTRSCSRRIRATVPERQDGRRGRHEAKIANGTIDPPATLDEVKRPGRACAGARRAPRTMDPRDG